MILMSAFFVGGHISAHKMLNKISGVSE